jgi:F0F1-type ATP synthase epsilon subunit
MLSLEIVTRQGRALSVEDLAEIVFRRREERFAQGSEVAIFPSHAPLLMQNAAGRIRWRDRRDDVHAYMVGTGLVEVVDNHVLVVADGAAPPPD